MTGAERREQIRAKLSQAQSPISATTLAKQFAVSRQTIVGDISLLRAHGTAIAATL
ncbi:HTH domain-containing protein, partial [Mycobacterium tuberculosis]